MAAVLVPRSWDGVDDLDSYLIDRRAWFYSLYALMNVVDVVDSYLKGGWQYVAELGPFNWAFFASAFVFFMIGIRSRNPKHHATMAVVSLIWQIATGPVVLPTLGR